MAYPFTNCSTSYEWTGEIFSPLLIGDSEICLPETRLKVPRGEAVENIEFEGKQNSLSPLGPVIKCFHGYTSQLKTRRRTESIA